LNSPQVVTMSNSVDVSTTVHVQRCLKRLGTQDPTVRAELLEYARRRLALLADRMFARFPVLHRHEEVEDVFQEAMIRLWKSLEEVGPTTVAGFMGLAALQMRRALVDLARNHFGRDRGSSGFDGRRPIVNANNGHTFEHEAADETWEPDHLACWSEFHEAADRLPEPERTVFDLLYYHELPQIEVAELMQTSERQVRRHWQSARRELHRVLEGAHQEST
jgi:RNA polymerase sigma factor (sigma-70 family)